MNGGTESSLVPKVLVILIIINYYNIYIILNNFQKHIINKIF